jgi:peptidoglycan/xylan/chitin deacetylase (PgdA/CDA1 family)
MLLVLCYHQLNKQRFRAHLGHIRDHYPVVLPGESHQGLSVCLTLDDATEDAYSIAWPLLEEFQMRALLAVPTGRVGQAGYCSWAQLREMARSPTWNMASHSVTHCNMANESFDPALEIVESRRQLEDELGVSVETFVYPYGGVSHHAQVMHHYRYAMRIGTAYNSGWECQQRPLNRVIADYGNPFLLQRHLGYWGKLQLYRVKRFASTRLKRGEISAPSGRP